MTIEICPNGSAFGGGNQYDASTSWDLPAGTTLPTPPVASDVGGWVYYVACNPANTRPCDGQTLFTYNNDSGGSGGAGVNPSSQPLRVWRVSSTIGGEPSLPPVPPGLSVFGATHTVALSAAKRHQMHRVGFGTRQLDFFTADWSSAAVRRQHRHTFTSQQMAALTVARGVSDKLRVLLVQGKFTRAQAKLLIAEGVV